MYSGKATCIYKNAKLPFPTPGTSLAVCHRNVGDYPLHNADILNVQLLNH